MKWENSEKTGQAPEELEENYHDELEYSPWETKKITRFSLVHPKPGPPGPDS